MERFDAYNNIERPVLVLDKDYVILFANRAAVEEYGSVEVGKAHCYTLSHGFDVPCWEFPEHPCPKKLIEENRLTQYSVIHLHETKLGSKYFLVDTSYSPKEQHYIEVHIDISEILEDLIMQGVFDKKDLHEVVRGPFLYTAKQRLLDEMNKKIQAKRLSYAATIDIEGMGYINKFYGMLAGDLVLRIVEKTIAAVLKEYDAEARFSKLTGDEFLLMFDTDSYQTVNTIENTIQSRLNSAKIKYLSEEISPIITLSTIEVNTDKAYTVHELLEFLSYGQIHAKQSREKRFVIHNDKEQEKLLHMLREEIQEVKSLEMAIKEKRVELHFQSISDLATRSSGVYEVLVRLRSEEGAVIPAFAFIDRVIEIGLIGRLDTLVLEELTEMAPTLSKVCHRLFINVAAQSLESPSYIGKLVTTVQKLRTYGMETVIELTEQMLIKDTDLIIRLRKEHGFEFAVDDFGTGYSSLKTVVDLSIKKAISYLKIDGSITCEVAESPDMQKVMMTISVMAKSMELKVIAEFVEDEKTHLMLQSYDIDFAQGYYYGKPAPLQKVLATSSGLN